MAHFQVSRLLNSQVLSLELLAGRNGLARTIQSVDVNRPGLALVGFYKNLAMDRIQVFGRGEHSFIEEMSEMQLQAMRKSFFEFAFPALVFTHGQIPRKEFIESSDLTATPLFVTRLSTHDFIANYSHLISEELSSSITIHGVFTEVFGVGVLLTGTSGIGKSETALELLERGHRLIADDMVRIKCLSGNELYGYANELLEHHMEIRGIGIINVKDLYGVGAIRKRKQIELVIHLEDWDATKEYERVGLEYIEQEILGTPVAHIVLPVGPGRNMPILIEAAAMNYRAKRMGFHAAKDLSEKIGKEIKQKKEGGG